MILDAHHHLWKVDRGDYHWMSPDIPCLSRDYLPEDLRPHLRKAGVTQTILVQAAQTEAETEFLLSLADTTDFIAGVTGWLDLADPNFPARLAHFRQHPKFRAIRPMIQDLADDAWILKPKVLHNLHHLSDTDFRIEFLTFPRHLRHVLGALLELPHLQAVVDHLSKPPIASGQLEPWATWMTSMAKHPNVYCKLSGLVTEANHTTWSPQTLAPYINHIINTFGSDRVMFGSDWPVCRLAAEYGEVTNALRTVVDGRLTPHEIDKIFYANAARFYGVLTC